MSILACKIVRQTGNQYVCIYIINLQYCYLCVPQQKINHPPMHVHQPVCKLHQCGPPCLKVLLCPFLQPSIVVDGKYEQCNNVCMLAACGALSNLGCLGKHEVVIIADLWNMADVADLGVMLAVAKLLPPVLVLASCNPQQVIHDCTAIQVMLSCSLFWSVDGADATFMLEWLKSHLQLFYLMEVT